MPIVNDTIYDTILLVDDDGVAITGKTSGDFGTLTAYLVSTPATTASVTLAEIGSGRYRFSFVPGVAGFWASYARYSAGGVLRDFGDTYEVTTAPAAPLDAQDVADAVVAAFPIDDAAIAATVVAAIPPIDTQAIADAVADAVGQIDAQAIADLVVPAIEVTDADLVATTVLSALSARGVTLSAPLNPATGTMTVVRGDDYLDADGRAFSWDLTGAPSLIGATIEWRAIRDGRTRLTKAMTVADINTTKLDLTSTDTGKLRVTGNGTTYTYAVVETAPDEITLATGSLVVQGN